MQRLLRITKVILTFVLVAFTASMFSIHIALLIWLNFLSWFTASTSFRNLFAIRLLHTVFSIKEAKLQTSLSSKMSLVALSSEMRRDFCICRLTDRQWFRQVKPYSYRMYYIYIYMWLRLLSDWFTAQETHNGAKTHLQDKASVFHILRPLWYISLWDLWMVAWPDWYTIK